MFTGIIENTGKIVELKKENDNLHITIQSPISKELKIDQSVSHNGICLTVVKQDSETHTVTAIAETLQKTTLSSVRVNDIVNLERCMLANGRFDGHIVQGHVDQTAVCTNIQDQNGSWLFIFEYDESTGNITVEKGSVCVNGISLTVVNSKKNSFSVAIIPYTFEHTNMNQLEVGDKVNIEFDIIGKYISKLMANSR